MAESSRGNYWPFLLMVGLVGWMLPGAGHLLLREKKRAIIIFITVVLTFCAGIYAGSIGVINPVGAKPWYVAQVMNSPAVAVLGYLTAGGGYRVYGWPNEIGQIYTSTAGLLNLLCIVNAVYLAYLRNSRTIGD
jgi:cytochrome bd-type quinol oxidase subunit 1